jgi:GTP pyrophosphokinase
METDRLIEVEWENQSEKATYEAELRIVTYNRTGLLAELSVALASQEVPVSAISAHPAKDQTYVFQLSIVIRNTRQLGKLIRDLSKIPDVIEVMRAN